MLRLAIVFLVIALVAAFMGYGGVANMSYDGARILFFVFLVLAVLSFAGKLASTTDNLGLTHCRTGKTPTVVTSPLPKRMDQS